MTEDIFCTTEFDQFMRVAHKLNGFRSPPSEIIENLSLGYYGKFPIQGVFTLYSETVLKNIMRGMTDEFPSRFTRTWLRDYSFLNHLPEQVKKAVFACICMANGSISLNIDMYINYLENVDNIEEFADFMNSIPKELKRVKQVQTDREHFELLFYDHFRDSSI